jgi:hypothetical protein
MELGAAANFMSQWPDLVFTLLSSNSESSAKKAAAA